MTAGKNKLLRHCRLYVNGGDLSGDSRMFNSAMSGAESIDMTGWSSAQYRSYLVDPQIMVGIDGYQAMMNDTAEQSFDQLKDAGVTGMEVTLLFGGGGAPSAGDPAYLMAASQFASQITFDEQKAIVNADFKPDSGVANHYKPLGVVLLPLAAVAGGVTGSTVDNIAATTVAYHTNLHVIVAGGDFTFKVRHSANGVDWADLATFTLDGSVVGSERLSGTGTVNQYRRVEVTQNTTGLCQAVIALATQ